MTVRCTRDSHGVFQLLVVVLRYSSCYTFKHKLLLFRAAAIEYESVNVIDRKRHRVNG